LKWFLDSGVIVPVPPTENVEWVSPGFFCSKTKWVSEISHRFKENK
jgi:hypothetical protein